MKLKVSWWITIFGLFLFVSKSHSQNSQSSWATEKKSYIDIDTAHNDFVEEGSGKLETRTDDTTDDEDMLETGSGVASGSGDVSEEEKYTTKAPTTKKLTPCQNLWLSTKDFPQDFYIPKCTPNGDYERLQCEGNPGNKKCWCVDPFGKEIPGTQKMEPHVPDCIEGKNLKKCVFEVLQQSHSKLLGRKETRCTLEGEYESIQCQGRWCWCVDKNGVEKANTKKLKLEAEFQCDDEKQIQNVTTVRTLPPFIDRTFFPIHEETTKKPHHSHDKHKDKNKPSFMEPGSEDDSYEDKDDDGYEIDNTPTSVDIDIGGGKFPEETEDTNENEKFVNSVHKTEARSSLLQMMESPGILAAVIGGSVVGLLCAILLVMFIVYRMRKKDEGSYPLEEQKYTNYSYMKAPDKEFYA